MTNNYGQTYLHIVLDDFAFRKHTNIDQADKKLNQIQNTTWRSCSDTIKHTYVTLDT